MKCLLILLFNLPLLLRAQNTPLVADGVAPNLYVTHTVQPKENYYSIGRLYNISPKEIAPFNNLQMDKGLNLNQVIKVPLTTNNFLQTGKAAADEVLIPVHHTLQEKEGLYRVTVNYNKLPLETLKKWNNIKGDEVPSGTNLIVGYLKVKKELSGLANMSPSKQVDNIAAVAPVVKKEVITKDKEPVLTTEKDIPVTVKETVAPAKTITPPEAKQSGQAQQTGITSTGTKNFSSGIFKKDFDKQSKKENEINENGSAATFKSNSGWEDGKYYCLYNTAPSGTIIKITNPSTGKMVYAKVLDVIPDIKQNSGLLIRISNAAARELGVGEAKFDCTLVYSK